MKIKIEVSSQDEYEEKLEELVKSLRGEPEMRRSLYPAQNEIADYWDDEFKKMISEMNERS